MRGFLPAEFVRFLLTGESVLRMIVFMVTEFPALSDFEKYAELRTNPVVLYRGFLLTRAMMHSTAASDERSVKALASLNLTPRETEVLFWISQGKSNHDIGIILGAKTGTICKHVEHIFAKLNVENRTAAALVAHETYRFAPPASESNTGRPWAAITGFITTQICALWSDSFELCGEIARLVA